MYLSYHKETKFVYPVEEEKPLTHVEIHLDWDEKHDDPSCHPWPEMGVYFILVSKSLYQHQAEPLPSACSVPGLQGCRGCRPEAWQYVCRPEGPLPAG